MSKLKKKFNIMDIIIILVVIAVCAAVVLVMGTNKQLPKAEEPATVVLEIPQKSESFCNAAQEGDIIKDTNTKKEWGKIIKKEVKPAETILTSAEEGKFVKSLVPDLYDVYLTISFNSGKEDVAKIGKSVYIQSHDYACTGFVVEILDEEAQK